MKKIVDIKEGILGNVFAIVWLLTLSSFTVWWGFNRDHLLLPVCVFFCLILFVGCYICFQNIIRPKSSFLAIDNDRLVWSVRTAESAAATETAIPLRSLRTIEFVLPKIKFEVNSRNYTLAELFLVDVHGIRHRMPMELWPGIHRKAIVAALKAERPDLEIVEHIEGVSH